MTTSLPCAGEGAWLIDQKKFHASVHGMFSCQDCHDDVGGRERHPNPEDIVQQKKEFFVADQCLACHDDVLDRLEQGMHGSLTIQTAESYQECSQCHEPHYQRPMREETELFDPNLPRHEQCGACHEAKSALPPLSPQDEACMACHRTFDPGEEERLKIVCFHCHGLGGTAAQEMTGRKVALMEVEAYGATPHANLACTTCHPQAVRYNHSRQEPADCTHCHTRHDEKVAHELHALVTCGACHLGGVEPVRKKRTGQVGWKRSFAPGARSEVHDMIVQYDEVACRNCHARENRIGAAAMILPPKSIICMPCHSATFSVGDATTVLALLVFAVGMFMMLAYVFTGTAGEKPREHKKFGIHEGRVLQVSRALFLDVLLQRRLYLQSRRRWLIHGLIFYPFVFRFSWGLIGLIASLANPSGSWVWSMFDKNDPLTGFLFDLTGIMLIFGVVLAWLRGTNTKPYDSGGSPGQDRVALALIGAIVLVGFLLQGMRISMTGYPPGAQWAFIGYPLAFFWAGTTLTGIYGYVWYVHAILTGAFIAYIPFSRLAHIIIAPVVLALNAAKKH